VRGEASLSARVKLGALFVHSGESGFRSAPHSHGAHMEPHQFDAPVLSCRRSAGRTAALQSTSAPAPFWPDLGPDLRAGLKGMLAPTRVYKRAELSLFVGPFFSLKGQWAGRICTNILQVARRHSKLLQTRPLNQPARQPHLTLSCAPQTVAGRTGGGQSGTTSARINNTQLAAWEPAPTSPNSSNSQTQTVQLERGPEHSLWGHSGAALPPWCCFNVAPAPLQCCAASDRQLISTKTPSNCPNGPIERRHNGAMAPPRRASHISQTGPHLAARLADNSIDYRHFCLAQPRFSPSQD